MHDSPIGMLAWMGHHRRNWSDCDGDVHRRFSEDGLLLATTLFLAVAGMGPVSMVTGSLPARAKRNGPGA